MFHSFHGLINSVNWPASSVWVFIARLVEHCSANTEATGSNPVKAPKNYYFWLIRICLNCDSLRWSHIHFICILPFTSFHSVFHSFHGLMNSINWPTSSGWIFIARLVEHCSAIAETTGSNPVEAPKNFFSGYFAIAFLKLRFNCDDHTFLSNYPLLASLLDKFTSLFLLLGNRASFSKAIMKMLGVDLGTVRSPLSTIDESQELELKKDLERIGFFGWRQ